MSAKNKAGRPNVKPAILAAPVEHSVFYVLGENVTCCNYEGYEALDSYIVESVSPFYAESSTGDFVLRREMGWV